MAQQVLDVVAHARHALHTSQIAEFRFLDCESDGERIVLQGSVGSFYYKQLAQELIRRTVEGLRIENVVSVEHGAWDDVPQWRAIERY